MDTDEDVDMLWCDDCHTKHGLDCPILGSTIQIQDRKVETRAFATLPESLQIKVIGGSRHVVAASPISRRTQFGPLEAKKLDGNQNNSQILYKIFDKKSAIASFDLSSENCCNWMSLVPLNPDPILQNLISFQHHGQIYFLASRDIKIGEMLYVWYSPNYAARMTAAATNDEIQPLSKKDSLEKPLMGVELLKREKILSQPRQHEELQISLLDPVHEASCVKRRGETNVRDGRRGQEENKYDSDDDTDTYDIIDADGSGDEQMESTSSETFLPKILPRERETQVEDVALENVMENEEINVSQDGILSYRKGEAPRGTSVSASSSSSVFDREICKESLPQEGKTIYKCSLCQVQLVDVDMFIRHLVEMHEACGIEEGRVRYSCYLCTAVLPSARQLQYHMTSQHKGHVINPLKCCKCFKVLQSFTELQQHELKHSSLLSVVCHVCGERFLKGAIDDHLKDRHAATEGYACLKCNFKLSHLEDLTEHVRCHSDCKQKGIETQAMIEVGQKKREEDKDLKIEAVRQDEVYYLDEMSRHEKQDLIEGGGVRICLDRLLPSDTRDVTVYKSESGEGYRCRMNVEGKRKVNEIKETVREQNRMVKKSKLFLEDESSERDEKGENGGEESGMNNLNDKWEMEKKEDDDEVGKNCDRKADNKDGLVIPVKRYNLRQQVKRNINENRRADQEAFMEEGMDESDNEEIVFKCHLCESEFKSKHKLNNHLGVHVHRRHSKAHVGDIPRYPCKQCKRVFYSSRSLVLHQWRSHEDQRQECQYCNYKCVAMVTLKEHVLSKHKEVDLGVPESFQYPCQDCDLVFLKFSRLTRHMETHFHKRFKCEKCHRVFSRKDGLQYHTCNHRRLNSWADRGHQNQLKHKCKYCQKEFDLVKVLNIHIFTHFINVPAKLGSCVLLRIPTNSGKELTCLYCHGQFQSPTLLVQHVSRAHQVNIFPCSLCFDILGSHDLLLEHLQEHAEKDFDNSEPQSILGSIFTCEDCFAVFPNKSTLQRHMTVHLKTKGFICDRCGRTFSRKDTLRNHLKSHTSFKPYQCGICGKYLKTLTSFQTHVGAHSEERKFQCQICHRSFKQKGNLNKHMSKCVSRRDIICKYCGLKFRDLEAVSSHEQHIHSDQQIVELSG